MAPRYSNGGCLRWSSRITSQKVRLPWVEKLEKLEHSWRMGPPNFWQWYAFFLKIFKIVLSLVDYAVLKRTLTFSKGFGTFGAHHVYVWRAPDAQGPTLSHRFASHRALERQVGKETSGSIGRCFFFVGVRFFFWGGVVLLRFRFVEIPKIALLPLLFKS